MTGPDYVTRRELQAAVRLAKAEMALFGYVAICSAIFASVGVYLLVAR